MKTKHTLALIICIAMLASLLLSLNASAKSGDFEFIVEEISNLFPRRSPVMKILTRSQTATTRR